jgi:hypothetical protein
MPFHGFIDAGGRALRTSAEILHFVQDDGGLVRLDSGS